MSNIRNDIVGIVLGINPASLEIPKELRDFLELDDQGINGLDFMLSDAKLSRRIPTTVRVQYEQMYAELIVQLDSSIEELKKIINEVDKNPKNVIHSFIDKALSNTKE